MRNILEIARVYLENKDRWEEVCSRCGRCCFEREPNAAGELMINYAAPCKFLDLESRECTVYDTRHRMQPQCKKLTLRDALFNRLLPEECAYRQLFL